MATKYGFSDVREQLVGDLKGAYPTKREDFESTSVLGEDVFGSPKPHPNAVLNLFLEQNVKFASPFAAYRASLRELPTLISGEPGAVLPRLTLASIIRGREEILRVMAQAAHTIAYKDILPSVFCGNKCMLNRSIDLTNRAEILAKIRGAMIGERKGGPLSTPSLESLACAGCIKKIEASHATWRSRCWELLPATFSVAKGWDEV